MGGVDVEGTPAAGEVVLWMAATGVNGEDFVDTAVESDCGTDVDIAGGAV